MRHQSRQCHGVKDTIRSMTPFILASYAGLGSDKELEHKDSDVDESRVLCQRLRTRRWVLDSPPFRDGSLTSGLCAVVVPRDSSHVGVGGKRHCERRFLMQGRITTRVHIGG